LVKVVYGSFWRADISEADGIFVFLIGRYMAKLSRFFDGHAKDGLKVVSNAFQLPGRKPVKKQSGLFLYRFTAKH